MKVIIDSGHCKSSPGAVAFGMTENKLNLIYARLLAEKLEQMKIDIDRSLINDNCYSSTKLGSLIKDSGSSLCISCHNNSYNGNVRGFEVIHSIHAKDTLSQYIVEEVKKTGFSVRRAFSRESSNNPGSDYYYIIRLTYPEVETVIVEFGFMDNKEDYRLITDPTWQEKLTSAVAAAVRRYIPESEKDKTSITGKAILTSNQLKSALKDRNPAAGADIVDIYYNIADVYGIKADLAFLQAMLETGWMKFSGVVKPQQNNFAGLGAYGGNPGESFSTAAEGVEAHLQHLYAYSTTSQLPKGRILKDTRFHLVKRGSAPSWEDLDGRWAVPGVGYGRSIVKLQESVFNEYPASTPDTPQYETPMSPQVSKHWAKPCNDELMNAGLLNSDHTDTLDSYATEGMVICLFNRLRREFKNE